MLLYTYTIVEMRKTMVHLNVRTKDVNALCRLISDLSRTH